MWSTRLRHSSADNALSSLALVRHTELTVFPNGAQFAQQYRHYLASQIWEFLLCNNFCAVVAQTNLSESVFCSRSLPFTPGATAETYGM